jgi:hypothetical protein
MSVSLASLYLTKLLIIGCTSGECPQSVEPEQWVGLGSRQECEQAVDNPLFDPEKYLPGFETYIVRCE